MPSPSVLTAPITVRTGRTMLVSVVSAAAVPRRRLCRRIPRAVLSGFVASLLRDLSTVRPSVVSFVVVLPGRAVAPALPSALT